MGFEKTKPIWEGDAPRCSMAHYTAAVDGSRVKLLILLDHFVELAVEIGV